MKIKIFIVGLVVFYVLAIKVNFLNFPMSSDASLTNLLISFGFIIYWVVAVFTLEIVRNFYLYDF